MFFAAAENTSAGDLFVVMMVVMVGGAIALIKAIDWAREPHHFEVRQGNFRFVSNEDEATHALIEEEEGRQAVDESVEFATMGAESIH